MDDIIINRVKCMWIVDACKDEIGNDKFFALFYYIGSKCEEYGIRIFLDESERNFYQNVFDRTKEEFFSCLNGMLKDRINKMLEKYFKIVDSKIQA